MNYEVLDVTSGQVLDDYQSLPEATAFLQREVEAGGSVANLAVVRWDEGDPHVELRGSELDRGAVVTYLDRVTALTRPLAYIGPLATHGTAAIGTAGTSTARTAFPFRLATL